MKHKVRLVFDRKKKAASQGVGVVELSVYLGRSERKFIQLAKLKPEEFYAYQMSSEAKEKIERCNIVLKEMEDRNDPMTIEVFSSKFLSSRPSSFTPKSLIDFIADVIDEEKINASTRKHKKVTLDAIIRFGKLRTFKDLTVDNLRAFDKFLHYEADRTDATVHNYHKHVMKWSRIAYERHFISDDPYRRVHFPRGKSKERNPLSENELVKLRELPLSGHLSHARDLFIFSAYTGIAYIDVCSFNFETMTEEINGTYYIDGSRLKTGNCTS